MGDNARTIDIDPTLASGIEEYLSEALHGPALGGIAGDLQVGAVKIDAAASRDWGVEFSRSLPTGAVARERLAGQNLTAKEAAGALRRLLHA